MRTSFYVEESPCERTCSNCSDIIDKGDISVRTWYYLKFCYFHLNCYNPGLKQYIYKKDLEVWLLSLEKEKIFNSWIDSWNKNYSSIDEANLDIPLNSKFIYSKPSTHRRGWLEIFKFLNAKEISLSISRVNRDFYIISCDEELWYFNLLRDYGKFESSIRNYRDQYILLVLRTCHWCHNNTDEANIIGNLFNKSICNSCKGLRRFDKMTAKQIENKYEVDANFLDIKFDNSVEGWKRTYRYMVLEKIKKNKGLIRISSAEIELSEENNLDLMLPDKSLTNLSPYDKQILKIIIVGDSTVGKTSLMNQYVIKRFSEVYRVTIGADYLAKNIMINNRLTTLQIWDKPGWECYFKEEATFYCECNCCMLVYDITSKKSFDNIKSWKQKILLQRNDKDNENFPFILIGNKVDREDERKIVNETARKWCRENGNIPFYETSAKDYINIDDAFMTIAKNVLIYNKADWLEDSLTDINDKKSGKKSAQCAVF